jgi:DNA mismatch endonuclease (patch repair protein)
MERLLRNTLPTGRFENVSAATSRAMAAVRSKHAATTERRFRALLISSGLKGWTMHSEQVLGRPDFLFPAQKLAIFVDGCFWHGCKKCGHVPLRNPSFWRTKIEHNRRRDRGIRRSLRRQRFRVFCVWEHELRYPQRRLFLVRLRRMLPQI